ncbi:MAG TPA: tetratricopeptide repeat protein, partial [Planctomycetota bacterium]|nr:tetratricopeptide repeat protein [Planctomycetota bacterium]
ADQPAVAAALLEAMGNVYLNLGLLDQSEQLLQDAAKLREQLGTEPAGLQQVRSSLARVAAEKGDDATSERLWRAVIEALPGADAIALAQADLHLARALWRQDRMDAAEQLLVSAVATLRRLLPADDLRLGFALADHAEFLEERDDPDRAAPLFVEALARCAQRLPPDHPDLIAVQLLAARNDLSRNRAAAAETKLRQLLHTAETVFDQNHPLLAQVREALAVALTFSDQFAAARDLLDQALAAYQVIHQPPHFALARARMLEADIAFELGDLGRAETAAAASLAMYEQLFPHGHLDLAAVLGNQARVQAALGHLDVAQQCAERALQMHQQLGQRKPSHLALAQAHLAYVQAHHNQLEPAERNAREALARLPPAGNEQARRNARCYLGEVLCFCWKGTEAEAVLREVLADDARSPTPPSPAARGWSLFVLGWAVLLQDKTTPGKGKPEEAEPLLRESLQLRRQAHGDRHPLVGIVADELGVALARMGRLDEAAEQIELAVSIRREHSGADSEYLALPLLNLGTLRTMQKRPADAVPLATDCLSVLEHHGTAGHPQVVALVQLWLRLLPHLPAETARTVLPRLSAFADRLLPADNPLRGELQTASKKLGG